jgi:deoxyribonuclease-4
MDGSNMDMLIRKKVLKIQERLGMRLGIAYGCRDRPVVKSIEDVMFTLRELYKAGLKAFVLPRELFSSISSASDLYKSHYGDLLKIKEEASKLNIELSLHNPSLTDMPDEQLKTFCSIASIMDARIFVIRPNFYRNIPNDQALRLVVYKINEILNELRVSAKIGIETTGKIHDPGSLEDVIDIVKRTRDTEPVINWAHIHARGVGALRDESDYQKVIDDVRSQIGQAWLRNTYFLFSGASYGPSGITGQVPLRRSDMNIGHLIRQVMSFGIQGTLIIDDPEREKLILGMLDELAQMVR